MEIERAKEIVKAINARAMVTMGMDVPMASLAKVTLLQMMEAKAAVEAMNAEAREHHDRHGWGRSIYIVPDDRLIAAVYALSHFPPSRDPILCLPFPTLLGTHIALACVAVSSDDMADDEED